ncbi:bacteriohemerythrin [Carboxylicivirga linearis]|nr:bacteriohemerythrin [Carboxylicivirga linearis]
MTMWTEELSVNNVEIDNEHKKLFDLLNDFYKGIQSNSPKFQLQELIVGLLDYTKTHFAREEDYMKRIGYPEFDDHQQQHAAFIEKAQSFHTKLTEGKMILSLEVTNFLKQWLVNHIKGTDQKYARYASENADRLKQFAYN